MSSLLEKQYANSKNFMARIELNRRFGTNPYRWTLWIFDQFKFPKGARVLEIGCGNALFWRSNLNRIPDDANILLSDFSEGMFNDARKVLKNATDRFEYEIINAQQITYPEESFDIVIANLMLYHIPDRKKAISEISRVLKTNGALYTTTFGRKNLKELNDLVSNFDDTINCSLEPFARAFGLENGEEQLIEYFDDIRMMKYRDDLEVTEAKPLVNYVLSFGNINETLKDPKREEFRDYIAEILKKEGKIKITKDMGIFIATKPK